MKIITSPSAVAGECLQVHRAGRTIGLVPTMGFLHDGHLSLIRLARQKADVVAVSIFVNPIQFAPGEDLDRYPRDVDRDVRLCSAEGVDFLFCPEAREMYNPNHSVFIEEEVVSHALCGLSRPGHFKGVLTVVAKLFNLIRPDIAVFGQKDAQQCRVVMKMVEELDFQVQVVVGPTVREKDGLAMSSRNVYLSAGERRVAVCIPRSLELARKLFESGTRTTSRIKSEMRALIDRVPDARIEYIETIDSRSWKSVDVIEKPCVVALAVRIGNVRLIDNITIDDGAEPRAS